MSLSTRTRLGHYEILAPIGAGGMGEVYRARDPKLGRDVAIKILPEAFAHDAERLARFPSDEYHTRAEEELDRLIAAVRRPREPSAATLPARSMQMALKLTF